MPFTAVRALVRRKLQPDVIKLRGFYRLTRGIFVFEPTLTHARSPADEAVVADRRMASWHMVIVPLFWYYM